MRKYFAQYDRFNNKFEFRFTDTTEGAEFLHDMNYMEVPDYSCYEMARNHNEKILPEWYLESDAVAITDTELFILFPGDSVPEVLTSTDGILYE